MRFLLVAEDLTRYLAPVALSELGRSVVATVLGGVVLAVVFFLLKDVVFRLPRLSGHWVVKVETLRTCYPKYTGMKLFCIILLWQEGNRLHGTGETVFEDANGRVLEYIGDKRVRLHVSGYVTKRYLARDEVVIHIDVDGRIRQSSSVHSLVVRKSKLVGQGVATAANQMLAVEWKKGEPDGISYKYAEPTTLKTVDEG